MRSAGTAPGALPVAEPAVAVGQRQQRRHQQREHRLDRLRRIAPGGAVAGGEVGQQRDRLHLRRAGCATARRRRCRPARRARGPARPRRTAGAGLPSGSSSPAATIAHQAASASELVLGACRRCGRASARSRPSPPARAARSALVAARQDQRRVHQPAEQPRGRRGRRSSAAPLPGLALASSHAREHPLGGRRALRARGAGLEVAQPGEAVDRALERRASAWRRGEKSTWAIGVLTPWTRKCPARSAVPATGSPGSGLATVASRRGLAGLRNGAASVVAGHAEAVGEADQPLAAPRSPAGSKSASASARPGSISSPGGARRPRVAASDQRGLLARRCRAGWPSPRAPSVAACAPVTKRLRAACSVIAVPLERGDVGRHSAPGRRRSWRSRRPARRPRRRRTGARSRASIPPSTSSRMSRPGLVDHLAHRLDLAQLAGDEALPAEARIDAHHQHQVDVVDQVVEHLGRRRRVERDAGLLAERLDRLDRAVDVRPGFGVDGDDVGPGLGERLEPQVDRRDHQVDVERLGGVRAQAP